MKALVVSQNHTLDALRLGWIPRDKLLSHCWPLAEFAKAFDQIERGEVIKGMLTM